MKNYRGNNFDGNYSIVYCIAIIGVILLGPFRRAVVTRSRKSVFIHSWRNVPNNIVPDIYITFYMIYMFICYLYIRYICV